MKDSSSIYTHIQKYLNYFPKRFHKLLIQHLIQLHIQLAIKFSSPNFGRYKNPQKIDSYGSQLNIQIKSNLSNLSNKKAIMFNKVLKAISMLSIIGILNVLNVLEAVMANEETFDVSVWTMAKRRKSCEETCVDQGKHCNPYQMTTLDDQDKMLLVFEKLNAPFSYCNGYSTSTVPKQVHLSSTEEWNDNRCEYFEGTIYDALTSCHTPQEIKWEWETHLCPCSDDSFDELTHIPTSSPSAMPSVMKTAAPTSMPSGIPTSMPTGIPSVTPTRAPITNVPTLSPTVEPPTMAPTTNVPTTIPTSSPSNPPTGELMNEIPPRPQQYPRPPPRSPRPGNYPTRSPTPRPSIATTISDEESTTSDKPAIETMHIIIILVLIVVIIIGSCMFKMVCCNYTNSCNTIRPTETSSYVVHHADASVTPAPHFVQGVVIADENENKKASAPFFMV